MLNEFAFIELNDTILKEKPELNFLKGVPIPVNVDAIERYKENQEGQAFLDINTLAKGMIQVIGKDGKFKYNEAYVEFLKLASPDIIQYMSVEGLKLAEQKKFQEAGVYFKAALFVDSEALNPLYNYARCCVDLLNSVEDREKEKQYAKVARDTFEKIIKLYPEFDMAYYYLGFFYVNLKLYQKADWAWDLFFQKTEDENKKKEIGEKRMELRDYVQYEKGYHLILEDKTEEGLSLLLPIAQKKPNWWNLLFFVGLAYRKMEQYEEAIQYFKKVMEIKPNPDALNELGLCYILLEDYERGVTHFNRALKLKPNDPELLANLGGALLYSGKVAAAKKAFEQAKAIDPEDEILGQWLAQIEEMV